MIFYLDDILLLASDRDTCTEQVVWLYDFLSSLGFLINDRKSDLVPKQTFQYLGLVWDTVHMTISLSEERVLKIRKRALVVTQNRVISCKQAASLEGSIISAIEGVPYARAKGRHLQHAISEVDLADYDFSKPLVVSNEVKQEAVFWRDLPMGLTTPIKPPLATQVITTDAAGSGGLGAELGGVVKNALVPSEFEDEDINVKELLALDFGLRVFEEDLHKNILWRTDNDASRWSILNQGSRGSKLMNDIALEILSFCEERRITIVPQRIESCHNLVADSASRGKQVRDWSLDHESVEKIFQRLGRAEVDMMATRDSAKLDRFWGWRKDELSEGIDSLSPLVSWRDLGKIYVFPPPPLIAKVLNKIREGQVHEAIIVAPWWPSKPFFPGLMRMTTDLRRIPIKKKLVVDLVSPETKINVKWLRLVAYKITGKLGEKCLPISPQQHPPSYNLHGGRGRKRTTAVTGGNGRLGAHQMTWRNLPRL